MLHDVQEYSSLEMHPCPAPVEAAHEEGTVDIRHARFAEGEARISLVLGSILDPRCSTVVQLPHLRIKSEEETVYMYRAKCITKHNSRSQSILSMQANLHAQYP